MQKNSNSQGWENWPSRAEGGQLLFLPKAVKTVTHTTEQAYFLEIINSSLWLVIFINY